MEKQIKKRKKPMKYKKFFIGFTIILILVSLFLIYNLKRVDVLSNTYLLIGTGILAFLDLIIIFFCLKRFKLFVKVPFVIIGLLLISGEVFGIYNLGKTASFVEKIVSASVKEEIYEIYVLNSSDIKSLKDLNSKTLGIYDNGNETLESALKDVKKNVTFKEEKTYDDIEAMLNDGIDKKIDAFFISSSMLELVGEEFPELIEKFKLLDKVSVSFKETVNKSDVDVTKEPFAIYISGIDTYGSISTVSRSDVNIIAVVNPKTSKILLVNTPRDYYVMLHSKKAYDKLTHAGIYGAEESLKTLEDLYAIDIDFYFKVNFSSLIKVVDAIGGITVNSKYAFSYDGYTFQKGQNKLDGAAALAFSRCRKELPLGDVSRGENQEAVIEAILDKVASPTIISKYSTILNTLSHSFVTNMSEKDIYKLAKYQLSENPKWAVETQNAKGSDASRTTYSAGKTKLYVMIPNEDSVTEVKNKINEVMSGN